LPERDIKIGSKLLAMLALVDKTVDAVRRISEDLRPGMLDDLGLAAAIEHHATKFAEQTGIACELTMNREHYDLDNRIATALFRVLQESLTNVARHAHATRVTVHLQDLAGEMLLIVKDNGCGLPTPAPGKKKTYGLIGMHERVKLLGGSLEIASAPGKGTRIEASLPFQAEMETS
jgi:two-component system, NarL family, sensor histidine kinase UhpB